MSSRAIELQRQYINAMVPKKALVRSDVKLYWYVRSREFINRVFHPGFKVPFKYEYQLPDLSFLKK